MKQIALLPNKEGFEFIAVPKLKGRLNLLYIWYTYNNPVVITNSKELL